MPASWFTLDLVYLKLARRSKWDARRFPSEPCSGASEAMGKAELVGVRSVGEALDALIV